MACLSPARHAGVATPCPAESGNGTAPGQGSCCLTAADRPGTREGAGTRHTRGTVPVPVTGDPGTAGYAGHTSRPGRTRPAEGP